MFEPGKKVVCIKSHRKGYFKRSKVYTVKDVMVGGCKHFHILLDLGINLDSRRTTCPKCEVVFGEEVLWCDATCFLPYDDSLSEVTVDDVLSTGLVVSELVGIFSIVK
jgi:hypothetical protein